MLCFDTFKRLCPTWVRAEHVAHHCVLKVEQELVQLNIGLPVDALTHEESQLVGIHAGSRHSDDSLKPKYRGEKKSIFYKISYHTNMYFSVWLWSVIFKFNNRLTFFSTSWQNVLWSLETCYSTVIQDVTRIKTLTSRHAYLPVIVHVAQLVGEPLHVIRLQSAGVVHHIVVGWSDTSTADRLAHYVEVIPDKIAAVNHNH